MCYICGKLCRFLCCLAWFDTVVFNRLPCLKIEMYDDAVFANQFQYQLTMFGIRVLIWLSRFLHAHIEYVIETDKIIAPFIRISFCLLDLIRQKSIVCHVQTTRYTMMRISLIDSAINRLCLKFEYWYGYLDSFMHILHT